MSDIIPVDVPPQIIFQDLHDYERHLITQLYSPRTIERYRKANTRFLEWAHRAPRDITPELVIRYQEYLVHECHITAVSVRNELMAIASFCRFLGLRVFETIKMPNPEYRQSPGLTREEASRLLKAVDKATGFGRRDYAILMVFLHTGARTSEVSRLRIDDINFENKSVRIIQGKGAKDRVVLLTDKTIAAIHDYLLWEGRYTAKLTPDTLFVSGMRRPLTPRALEYLIKSYGQKAGLKKSVTPKMLRKTFATLMLQNGADIRVIQELLGHESVATTQIYTSISPEHLRASYNKACPNYDTDNFV